MSTTLRLAPGFAIPFTPTYTNVSNPNRIPFVAEVAPFNSGSWIMYHFGCYPCTVGIEWSDVDTSIDTASISLVVTRQATPVQVHQFSFDLEIIKHSGKIESSFSYYSQPGYAHTLKVTWTSSPPKATKGAKDFAQTYSRELRWDIRNQRRRN